jgi:hypothetical protein
MSCSNRPFSGPQKTYEAKNGYCLRFVLKRFVIANALTFSSTLVDSKIQIISHFRGPLQTSNITMDTTPMAFAKHAMQLHTFDPISTSTVTGNDGRRLSYRSYKEF